MIRTMGKKAKQKFETPVDRERTAEADYYARKCGLTREEALRIMNDARSVKPRTKSAGEKSGIR